MKELLKEFWCEEDGMGTVEIVLIVVVLISLAVIFNKKITGIVNSVFNGANQELDTGFGIKVTN